MAIQKRDIVTVFLLTVFTFGLYYIYWLFKTTSELNSLGADLPTAFIRFIPFLNFYFLYRYTQALAGYVHKSKNAANLGLFLIAVFIPFNSLIMQYELNKLAK